MRLFDTARVSHGRDARDTADGPETASKRRARARGFSLVELTAVLALMAVLAGIITISVRPLMSKGKQNAVRAELANICAAIDTCYNLNGAYPPSDEGLAALTRKSERLPEPLLKQLPTDPWGHPYQYNLPGRNGEPYEVVCFGADGREGGTGADADIYSWNLKDAPASKGASH